MILYFTESSVGTGAGCFPAGSIVHTENGPRDIASIQKGDRVLAADDNGKMIYSEVSYHSNYIKLNNFMLIEVVIVQW